MSTFATECPGCRKCFKSFYSLNKPVRKRHEGIEESAIVPVLKDGKGDATPLPKPREALDSLSLEGYQMWLSRIIERLNATFHPRLPGRWVKVDCYQVPKKYFEYFIGKTNAKVNSVREVCHKAQPCYQASTRKISYKIFDADNFFDALEESEVTLKTELLYSGNAIVEETETGLSAEQEILRAKQRVHITGVKRRRPSSKSSLIVGYGEGRATRQIELIWWPDLYSPTDHGQFVIRLFIQKCEF